MISVFSVPPTSDDPAPSTVISTLFRLASASMRSLAAAHCRRRAGALADRKLRAEFRFHQPGQREIQIVAAEQQVLAHRRARKLDAVAIAMHADQREIAGAAADVAHQHQLPVEKALLRLRQMIGDPGIKRRRRLFHQRELFDPGGMRGLHGQLARFFVETTPGRSAPHLAMPAVRWDAPGSRHRECSTGSRWKHPPAKAPVRPPARPTAGFWPCDPLPDSTATISPSVPIWSAPARPAHARTRRRKFDRPETKTTAASGAPPFGPARHTAGSASTWISG